MQWRASEASEASEKVQEIEHAKICYERVLIERQ